MAIESEQATPSSRYRETALGAAAFPGTVMVLFLILMGAWRSLSAPTPEEMYRLIVDFFTQHGLWVVAIGALGEGVAVFNLYFPGSAAILLGVVASKGDPLRAAEVILVASAGFVLAAQVNYCIGYYGLHPLLHKLGGKQLLQRSQRRYTERGVRALFWGYFHPNIGGLMAVAAGTSRLRWRSFVAVTTGAIVMWNLVWGVIVFIAARPVEKVATSPYLVLLALAIWLVVSVLLAIGRTWRAEGRRRVEQATTPQ